MNYDLKLVAYEPFGKRIGPLPQPLHIEAANPLSDTSSMRIKYSRNSPGAEHLSRPIEVAMEVLNPATGNWFEPSNSRFLSIRSEGDRLDTNGVVDYVLPGYGWLLSKVAVYPLSKDFLQGQVQDAEGTEKSKRDALNVAEDAVTKALGMKDSERVVIADNAPQGTSGAWIDTTNKSNPITKTYVNNAWAINNRTGVQAAGKSAYSAWVAHQESQGQLSDTQARAKLTKRTFTGRHPGSVLAELIAEARSRGNRLEGLTASFSATKDSAGNPWPSFPGSVEVNVGSSLAKVLETFVEAGQLDFRILKRELQLYPQNTAMERKLDAAHTLRYGVHIDEAPDRSTFESVAGEVLFMGDEGLSFTRTNPEAPQPWGVWETSVAQSGVKSEAVGDRMARNMLEQSSRQRVERTRALYFREGISKPLPYAHYVPGDYVHAPGSDGSIELQRVQQITLTRDGKTGLVAGNVVLNDRLIEREIRNSRTTDALMGGAGSLGGNGGPRDNETYVDYRTPVAPRYLAGRADANYVRDIGYQAYVALEWYWDAKATNGTSMEQGIAHWQVQYRMFQEGTTSENNAAYSWRTAPNVDGGERETVFGPVDGHSHLTQAPAVYQIRVRGYATNGKVSDWSKTYTVTVALDTEPPEAPSRPDAQAEGSVIWVTWDGKNALGGNPPADLDHVRVDEAVVPDGVEPDAEGEYADAALASLSWNEGASYNLHEAGPTPVMGREYGKRHAYRLVAVDMVGNESKPSLPSPVAFTSPLVDDTLINERLEYARQELIRDQAELVGKFDLHDKAIAEAKNDLANLDTFVDAELGKVTEKFTGVDTALGKAATDSSEARKAAAAATLAAGDAANRFSELDAKLTAALAAKPGLMTDSSFELPERWATSGGASLSTTVGARNGSAVLVLPKNHTNNPPSGSVLTYSLESVDIVQGHVYEWTAFIKRSDATAPVDDSLAMRVRNHATGTLVAASPRRSLKEYGVINGAWTRVTGTWEATQSGAVNFGLQATQLTADLYIDDFQVVDSTAEASLKLQVEAALKDAQAAARAAQAAATVANQAQAAADGKTVVRYELTDPVGVGVAHGDTWYRVGSGDRIIGHWRWSNTNKAWLVQKLDGAQVANFDAGYITSGFLDVAQRVRAGSIQADKMLIGVGDNMIPWNGVLTGVSVAPHVVHPSDSTITLGQIAGVSSHIFAENRSAGSNRYVMRLCSGGQSAEGQGNDFPVTAGKNYRFESTIRAGGPYPEGLVQVRITIAWRAQGENGWITYSVSDWKPLTWANQQIAVSAEAPAGAVSATLFVMIDRPGGVRVIEPSFREMTTGDLIVNGTINSNHVNADSITAMTVNSLTAEHKNLIVSGDAKISGKAYIETLAAKEIVSAKIKVDQLTALDANFDEAVVNKLWAQKIAAKKISANEVIIGTGANLIVNGHGELGDGTNFSNFSRSDSSSLNSPIGASWSFWTSSRSGLTLDNNWQVEAGRTYFWRLHTMAKNTGQRCYVQVRWFDASGSAVTSPYVVANGDPGTGSWKEWSGQITAPANAVTANLTLYANHSNGSWASEQYQRWGGLVFQPASDGKLIVDGSITTNHMDAKTFDVTKLLRANSIEAQYLKVDEIKNAVRVDSFIFSGYTFYGAKFYTSTNGEFATDVSSNRGFHATNKGVSFYNSRGERVVNMDGGTGDAEFSGVLSTSTAGKAGIKILNSESSWNNSDMGIWFTLDGNAYGWGNTDASKGRSVAGLYVTPNSNDYRWDDVRIRGRGRRGGVINYNNLEIATALNAEGGQRPALLLNGGPYQHIVSNAELQIFAGSPGYKEGKAMGAGAGNIFMQTGAGLSSHFILQAGGNVTMRAGARQYIESGNTYGIYLKMDGWNRYNKQSSSGGNLRMAADGCIVEDLSSRRWKRDIQDAERDERILDIAPKTFVQSRSLQEKQELENSMGPLTEEENNRLIAADLASQRMFGAIAEEVDELGMSELVNYDLEGKPASLHYELFALKMLPFLTELWDDYKARTAK